MTTRAAPAASRGDAYAQEEEEGDRPRNRAGAHSAGWSNSATTVSFSLKKGLKIGSRPLKERRRVIFCARLREESKKRTTVPPSGFYFAKGGERDKKEWRGEKIRGCGRASFLFGPRGFGREEGRRTFNLKPLFRLSLFPNTTFFLPSSSLSSLPPPKNELCCSRARGCTG